jgi:hypothetical protein
MSVATQSFLVASAVSGVSTYVAKTFKVSDFAGASALLSVFDQYRIDQIECWLEFPVKNSGTVANPILTSCVDLDDATTPSSLGEVQDRQDTLVASGPVGMYHRFRPHMATAVYSGAFTSFSNVPAGWIDSGSPNVEHYGLKAALTSYGSAFTVALSVRAVLSFRAPVIN